MGFSYESHYVLSSQEHLHTRCFGVRLGWFYCLFSRRGRHGGVCCVRSRPVVLQLGCVLEFIKGVLRITDAWPHSQRCQFSLGGTLALMIFKCSLVILLQPG